MEVYGKTFTGLGPASISIARRQPLFSNVVLLIKIMQCVDVHVYLPLNYDKTFSARAQNVFQRDMHVTN